jgi:hypothetical protein
MGRRTVPSDVVRNIELLVGVALPLFLTGVWLQDHLTGSGHWARPLESGFFEWLSLAPLVALVGLLHTVAVAGVAGYWPRAASRAMVLLLAVLMTPLLVLAGHPVEMLTRYLVPLLLSLGVYALASHLPGTRASPPEDDLRAAPPSEHELLGPGGRPGEVPAVELPPATPPPPVSTVSREAR